MANSIGAGVGKVLRGLWRALEFSRRLVFNLLFALLLIGALVLWAKSGPPTLQDKTTLVLDLQGPVVEQFSGSARDKVIGQLQGDDASQIRLRDLLEVIDTATRDPKVNQMLLRLDGLGAMGLPMLRDVAAALQRFKAAGKSVVAYGNHYEQRAYYLAAQADEVWMNPMGMLTFEGYGRMRTYYKDVLDKMGVQANVLTVGRFKSFGEIYSRSGPSAASTEAETLLYGSLWADYLLGVEAARKLPAGSLQSYSDQLPEKLAAAGGDVAKVALQAKLVDALKNPDEVRQLLIERGALDSERKSFRQVSYQQYRAYLKPAKADAAVGIIVAEGNIVDGEADAGTVGGDSTAELVKKAREDDKIKAVVLRVNSPGGSATASERVRRELALTRQAGKPVVVSMGNVAASGGYWISMAADVVIADPGTVTGSIGVVAILPTAKGAMDKLGLHTEGYVSNWLGKAYDPRREIDPRLLPMVQQLINHAYVDFTGKAALARKTTPDKIDAVGQGRVWTGAQALEHGLIDRTGNLSDAVAAATKLAKLDADSGTRYIEREPGRLQRLMLAFASSSMAQVLGLEQAWSTAESASWIAQGLAMAMPAVTQHGASRDVTADMQALLRWSQPLAPLPMRAVVHCLCVAP